MTNSDEPIPRADGGPAFPVVEPNHPTPIVLRGMTLRDYFAGQAMAGLCESAVGPGYNEAHIAAACWRLADAMLDERSQATNPLPHNH